MTSLLPETLSILSGLALVSPVFGYIDPGSGSAIISAIIGFFVALLLAVKTYWYKLKSFFMPKSSNEELDEK